MNAKKSIISTAEHCGAFPIQIFNIIYTLLNKGVLGASLITDVWSYINKWKYDTFLGLKITVGIKMADADREVK